MFRVLISRLCSTFRRCRVREEFDEEIREHLRLLTERFVASGMEPGEGRHAAQKQFGAVTLMREDLRERREFVAWDVLWRDVRHAFGQFRKSQSYAVSAVITLALGIGAMIAGYAVLEAVLFRPLPFANPDRLVSVRPLDHNGSPSAGFSYPNFFDFRARNGVFEQLVSYSEARFSLTELRPPIQVPAAIVSWDLFSLLKMRPALGRGFAEAEEKPGEHVIVVSDSLWKSLLGGDPAIVGKHLQLNGAAYTVVGVAPAGLQFPVDHPAALWTTIAEDVSDPELGPLTKQRGARMVNLIGRLRAGVTDESARADMDRIASELSRAYPQENIERETVVPEAERLRETSKKQLWLLLLATGTLLLIACANTGTLLVCQMTDRARDFALRSALGASLTALIRQVALENLALSVLATMTGGLLAAVALRAILPLAADSIPRLSETSIDGHVLLFSGIVALLISVIFSLATVRHLIRVNVSVMLKEGFSQVAGGLLNTNSALVIGQVTFGLVLLMLAELTMASFVHFMDRDPGFRVDHLLTFDVDLASRYSSKAQVVFCDLLEKRFKSVPGVTSAARGTPLPLEGNQMFLSFDIVGVRSPSPQRASSDFAIVSPGYFDAIGIPLLEGRDFSPRDDASAAPVVMVNQAFAQKYLPGRKAVGQLIQSGHKEGTARLPTQEIVGVVGNARQRTLTNDDDPIFYFPVKQMPLVLGTMVLRTLNPPREVVPALQATLAGLDGSVAMFNVRTGEDLSNIALGRPRFQVTLIGIFAAIAVLLEAQGLYAVMSFAVSRRRREMAVRRALGAGCRDVRAIIFLDALKLVATGVTLGLAGAILIRRPMGDVIPGIELNNPMFLIIACGAMAVVSVLAVWVPAERAASADPLPILRSD